MMAVVTVDHAALRAAAHRYGATTNDAILVAVGGALHQYLLSKGESIDPIAESPCRSPATDQAAGRRWEIS